MSDRKVFNWFFYGHIWISLAAAALSWLSLRIVYGDQNCVDELPVLYFIFFSTLAIYTLHRYLSFQRAGERPTTLRYGIVDRHPQASLWVGGLSIAIAGVLSLRFITDIWPALVLALPVTIFYLTPPLRGWRRLRDLPYLKNLWVALAWTIMTVVIPVIVIESEARSEWADLWCGELSTVNSAAPPLIYANLYLELVTRFLFTGCIALLFDLRDLTLDRSQGVSTIAGESTQLHRAMVYSSLATCIFLSLFIFSNTSVFPGLEMSLATAYLLMIPLAYYTYRKTNEDWYAVVVNGLLLLPPFLYLLADDYLGAAAGAGGGLGL